ncbi:uncharacterized protein B0H18DRAFT_1124907 [Fomitopsis serialis]|uniref:uncharacterized protein n=1 Tax=Fomitopsis serialis TaxID=139415 RepID=UPI002007EC57|nr:uncharacterized protein B0H18DRAFT_1124907 [Neoantrodia serialis]KAH9915390.1 hypothetical protein B0H18DRAFT_1124907 [Neoantrodia serialis]
MYTRLQVHLRTRPRRILSPLPDPIVKNAHRASGHLTVELPISERVRPDCAPPGSNTASKSSDSHGGPYERATLYLATAKTTSSGADAAGRDATDRAPLVDVDCAALVSHRQARCFAGNLERPVPRGLFPYNLDRGAKGPVDENWNNATMASTADEEYTARRITEIERAPSTRADGRPANRQRTEASPACTSSSTGPGGGSVVVRPSRGRRSLFKGKRLKGLHACLRASLEYVKVVYTGNWND